MSDGKRPVFYGYVVLAVVWLAYFGNVGFTLYGVPVIAASMAEQMAEITPLVVGLAVGINTVTQGLSAPCISKVLTQKGARSPFIIGSLILTVTAAAFLFVPITPVVFVLFYGVGMGFGMGIAGIFTAQAAVNDWFHMKKSMAMAITLSAGGIGGFIGPLAMKEIMGNGLWGRGWALIAVSSGGVALICILFLKNRPENVGQFLDGAEGPPCVDSEESEPQEELLPLSVMLRERTIYYYIICYGTRNMMYGALNGHIIIYLTREMVAQSSAVMVISIMAGASLIGRFLCGAIPEKWIPPKIGLALGSLLMAGSLFIIALVPSVPVIFAATTVFGLGIGYAHVSSPVTIARIYGAQNFANITAGTVPFNNIISALGPALVGFVAGITGYKLPFIVVALIGAMGAGAALAMKDKYAPPMPQAVEINA